MVRDNKMSESMILKTVRANILDIMMHKQRNGLLPSQRLKYKDLVRISENVMVSIFSDKCCLWEGYITNENNAKKGTYINFYFCTRKVALHRLLYINFIDDIGADQYLKYSCDNKGKCCNPTHLVKFEPDETEKRKRIRNREKKRLSEDNNEIEIEDDLNFD
jgi:hypothetical protein